MSSSAEAFMDELPQLMINGYLDGVIKGLIIISPYIIGYCVLCLIIGGVKRIIRKRRKK